MSYYSRIYFNGDGVTRNYAIPFGYIKPSHVHVAVKQSGATDYSEVAYTFSGSSIAVLSAIPAAGTTILIYRETPKTDRLVHYSDNSFLTKDNMDLDSLQHFYVLQEIADLSSITSTNSSGATVLASSASAAASAAAADASTAARLVESFTTTINSAADAATAAAQNAQSAVSTANAASAAAQTAAGQVGAASTNATNALSTANTAQTAATSATNTANTALNTANCAASTASAAQTTANAAAGSAAAAQASAQTAADTAATLAAAVAQSGHGHTNLTKLDKIGEDGAGGLTYNGTAMASEAEAQSSATAAANTAVNNHAAAGNASAHLMANIPDLAPALALLQPIDSSELAQPTTGATLTLGKTNKLTAATAGTYYLPPGAAGKWIKIQLSPGAGLHTLDWNSVSGRSLFKTDGTSVNASTYIAGEYSRVLRYEYVGTNSIVLGGC